MTNGWFSIPIDRGRDLVAAMGMQESALNLDSGVTALVSYPWLAQKFGAKTFRLPPFMDEFVRQISDELIEALNVEQQTAVRRYRLTLEDRPYKSGLLWLETLDGKYPIIIISPLFVRTVFASATSENHEPCSVYFKDVSQLYKHRERTVADIDDVLKIFVSRFRQSMAFPLAHEMAQALPWLSTAIEVGTPCPPSKNVE